MAVAFRHGEDPVSQNLRHLQGGGTTSGEVGPTGVAQIMKPEVSDFRILERPLKSGRRVTRLPRHFRGLKDQLLRRVARELFQFLYDPGG